MKKKKAKDRWVGERKVPFAVGKITRREIDDVNSTLKISEYTFQKTMSRISKEMGGTYYDGIMKISVQPFSICVHYLKYMENLGTDDDPDFEPFVSWMVYPKGQKNQSKMFKIFSSPVDDSVQEWRKFLKWMKVIVEAVNTIRATKGDGLDKFSSNRAKGTKNERHRKSRI